MKKVLLAVAALLVLLVAAALIVPSFIDWNPYRGRIAAQIGAATGRQVAIDGGLDLELLPRPSLTVEGVKIANLPGAQEPYVLTVDRLDLALQVAPLLEGRFQVDSLTAQRPVLVMEVLPDGRRSWDFGAVGGGGNTVGIGRAEIENGTLVYRSGETVERVEDIGGEIRAASLDGPFAANTTLTWRDLAFSLDAESSGRRGPGAPWPLRAALGMEGATARFSGIAGGSGPAVAQGTLRIEGEDLRLLAAALQGSNAEAVALPDGRRFLASGDVTGGPDGIDVKNLAVEVGPSRASGALNVTFGRPTRADLALGFTRIELDPWIAALPKPAADRPAGPLVPLPALSAPEGVEIGLDLSGEAIDWNGGVVRQPGLQARLVGDTLTVTRLAGQFPGGASAIATGTLAGGAQPALSGELQASADNLRTFLGWLGLSAERLPEDNLRTVALRGRFDLAPNVVAARDVALRLDATEAGGEFRYEAGPQPKLALRVVADELNLDAYLPRRDAMGRESLEPAGADPLAATARFLGRTEVAADLDIGKLVWRGLAVQRVRLDATAGDNRLDIRQAAIGDALGTSLAAAGRIGRILPPEDFDLTVNAKSTAPAALARAFGLTPPPELDRLGDTAVDARLLSTANGLELTANSRAAGGTLDLSGTLGGVGGPDIAYNLKTRATWPKLTPLAEIFAPGAAASLARLDGLDLYAEVAGSNDVVSVSGLQGQMAGVAVNGEVTVDLAQARPVFDAKLQTGVLPAALFGGLAGGGGGEAGRPGGGRWSEAPLDLGWLAAADGTLALNAAAFETPDFRLENPALRATVKDRVLTLDQLDGGWAGGRVGMKGRLAGPAEGPAETALTLTVVDARPPSVPLAGGRATVEGGLLNLNLDLAAKGASQAALIADLSGGGRINLREGRVTGFDLASLSARLDNLDGPLDFLDLFGRASAGGATRIEAVDATLVAAGGTVRSDDVVANLEAAAVTGRFAAALPAWTLDSLFTLRLTRHPEAPPFTVAFVGPLDAPERRIDAGPLQGYIAARVAEAVARRAGAGALPEVLQNLPIPLPGAQRPPAQRPRPQQQPQPQPGEVFNDLLDSLLR